MSLCSERNELHAKNFGCRNSVDVETSKAITCNTGQPVQQWGSSQSAPFIIIYIDKRLSHDVAHFCFFIQKE